MESLKTLAAKIEKKGVYINRVKADLKMADVESVAKDLKIFLKRLREEKEKLQKQFDELYDKFN